MKWIVHRLRALASLLLLPGELFGDWLHCLRWGKGSPFSPSQPSLYYDIVLLAHTVEKGLSLTDTRASFGQQKIAAVLDLCDQYDWSGPSFPLQMAYGALSEYREFHSERNIDLGEIGSKISKFIERAEGQGIEPKGGTVTPRTQIDGLSPSDFLCSRWSCRDFTPATVPREDVERIVKCAQSAPSQCNRQSVRVHVYQGKHLIEELLRLQGGSGGFSQRVSNLFVVTSETFAWSGAKPRHQPYVDGGIFAMQLGMSCISHCYGCCFLNLAVTNRHEKQIKQAAGISQAEKLILMMAFGVPNARDRGAARSERLPVTQVLTFHDPVG
ncbi:nitroreductase family protein [Stieleria sp. ICT_E10.1]|uniref:nitroreductase family protein n=1 Tax=Stieleria sedimenti TaxID=2976331 RepID=UPI00217FEAAE|nr:nitroreductase family protein [Stieleria sedimenti]MCS7465777.1 nitroreductase family protein [Stieleria sedimenti]